MPEQAKAIDLKRGDARLREELTAPEVLSAGAYSWQWMYGGEGNPSATWLLMKQAHGAAAIPIYCDMEEKDAHYASQIETRKEGVLSRARRVVPASASAEDQRIAEFIEDVIANLNGFDEELYELLDAIAKGVSIAEIMYGFEGREIRATELKFRPQDWFSFGDAADLWQTGPLRLTYSDEMLPANKFVVYTLDRTKGNRWGRPLARRCWWPVWFKRQTVKFWLKFVEKGTGTVLAKYPQTADPEMKAKALEAAEAINRETAVAIPENFVVEILEKARQGSADVYDGLVRNFANREISEVILGQVLTSQGSDEGSGSRALGEVHEGVRMEKVMVDAKGLMSAVNKQLIRPLVTLNFGPDKPAPKLVIDYEEGDDLNGLATRDKTLFDMGLKIPAAYVFERYQIPEPEAGEDVLGGRAQAPAFGGLPVREPDEDDDEAEEAALAEAPDFEPPHEEPDQVAALAVEQAKAGYARMIERLVERGLKRFPAGGAA